MEAAKITASILNSPGPFKFRGYEFLMDHQAKCVSLADINDKFALFMDTGTGKTITAYTIMERKSKKFLVVCPKSIILTAWKDDSEKFFPNLKVLYMTKDYTRKWYKDKARQPM